MKDWVKFLLQIYKNKKRFMNKAWQTQSLQPLARYQVRKMSWIRYNYRVFSLQFLNAQKKSLVAMVLLNDNPLCLGNWPFLILKDSASRSTNNWLNKKFRVYLKSQRIESKLLQSNNISRSIFCLYMYVHIHGTNEHDACLYAMCIYWNMHI